MIVTINTDASFHPQHKVGAFAFWIICNQGKITKSGVLKEALSPTDAELRCIANALHTLLKSNFTGVTKVIINSDALWAFGMVGHKQNSQPGRKTAKLLKKLKEKYLPVTEMMKPIHEFRHVKAHSGTDEKRKWVNDWCDKQAKKEMRAKVKSLKTV